MLKNPLTLSAILWVVYLAATGSLVKFMNFALSSNSGSKSAFSGASGSGSNPVSGALNSLSGSSSGGGSILGSALNSVTGSTGSGGSGGTSGIVGGVIGAAGAGLL